MFAIDQEDFYVYETDPDDPVSYRYEGRWEPMRRVTETIAVRGGAPVEVELLFTRPGPQTGADQSGFVPHSGDRCPEAGQGRSATGRVFGHPPVAQAFENHHLGTGTGGGSPALFFGADGSVCRGQDRQTRTRRRALPIQPEPERARIGGRAVQREDRSPHRSALPGRDAIRDRPAHSPLRQHPRTLLGRTAEPCYGIGFADIRCLLRTRSGRGSTTFTTSPPPQS